MKILITGAGGFIGQYLTRELLSDPDNHLILTDISDPSPPPSSLHPGNATCIKADIQAESASLVQQYAIDAVFILHGIMSSGAEANFDLGFRVNFDATRRLLDNIRSARPGVRVVYASSIAVYGRPFPDRITEDVYPTPEGSYGCEKLLCETLINDYSRRGYIDGFAVRLPGVSVRPGAPAQAASSFMSGIIREPLAGRTCIVPTTDRSRSFWICSPNVVVQNLARLLTVHSDVLPRHKRVLNLPGSLVTIQEMRDALEKVAGRDKLEYIEEAEDDGFGDLVRSWPHNFDVSLALKIGLLPAESFERAVQDYVEGM